MTFLHFLFLGGSSQCTVERRADSMTLTPRCQRYRALIIGFLPLKNNPSHISTVATVRMLGILAGHEYILRVRVARVGRGRGRMPDGLSRAILLPCLLTCWTARHATTLGEQTDSLAAPLFVLHEIEISLADQDPGYS
jgi:hypothetical protein